MLRFVLISIKVRISVKVRIRIKVRISVKVRIFMVSVPIKCDLKHNKFNGNFFTNQTF